MKELSLNVLDIAENSVKANADLVEIMISETDDTLTIRISDNGTGMTDEVLKSVSDPFYTTRTTRKVGMGIPLFRLAAEQAGGRLEIESKHIDSFPDCHGTSVFASFDKKNIDFTPLGDIISTVTTLIQGHPLTDFVFCHDTGSVRVELDTREIRTILEEIPINSIEILTWIRSNLSEQYSL